MVFWEVNTYNYGTLFESQMDDLVGSRGLSIFSRKSCHADLLGMSDLTLDVYFEIQ